MKKAIEEIPKKWLYHKDEGAKLFDIEENPAGWVDSPLKLSVKEAVQISEAQELSESLDEEIGKVKPKKKGK
jgi:hypothetical protein